MLGIYFVWSAIRRRTVLALAACALGLPGLASAEIIWNGDFSTGDFTQWHWHSSKDHIYFHGVPEYGRPIQYSSNQDHSLHVGNGDLLQLVSRSGEGDYGRGPVRVGDYAARFRIKNSANGSEPDDCGNGNCRIRRTELRMHARTHTDVYNAMPQFQERWASISVYIPEDFEVTESGWLPLVFQLKSRNQDLDASGASPAFAIHVGNHGWEINHRTHASLLKEIGRNNFDSAHVSRYRPRNTASHLKKDFPSVSSSEAALADLNRGGWTDWVMHFKPDPRGTLLGGEGFLRLWKRSGEEEWIQVLDLEPRLFDVSGYLFDRGIFWNDPGDGSKNWKPNGYPSTEGNGGFNMLVGLYSSKDRVWDKPNDTIIYIDNVKVGGSEARFATMSPDGSSPAGTASEDLPPRPPAVIRID